jgi:hypothetical protein
MALRNQQPMASFQLGMGQQRQLARSTMAGIRSMETQRQRERSKQRGTQQQLENSRRAAGRKMQMRRRRGRQGCLEQQPRCLLAWAESRSWSG